MSNGTQERRTSHIINNTATSRGGGISTTAGIATVVDSVINSNQVADLLGTAYGGRIHCENSTLSLTNSTINANRATEPRMPTAAGSTPSTARCTWRIPR